MFWCYIEFKPSTCLCPFCKSIFVFICVIISIAEFVMMFVNTEWNLALPELFHFIITLLCFVLNGCPFSHCNCLCLNND